LKKTRTWLGAQEQIANFAFRQTVPPRMCFANAAKISVLDAEMKFMFLLLVIWSRNGF